MFIIQAILTARTEHIVYFLLAAWLEALEHDGHANAVPVEAKELPLRGHADVKRRLALLRQKLDRTQKYTAADLRRLRDVAAAFSVACERLREFSDRLETVTIAAQDGMGRSHAHVHAVQ